MPKNEEGYGHLRPREKQEPQPGEERPTGKSVLEAQKPFRAEEAEFRGQASQEGVWRDEQRLKGLACLAGFSRRHPERQWQGLK